MLYGIFFLVGLFLLNTFPVSWVAYHSHGSAIAVWFVNIFTHMFGHGNFQHLMGNFMFMMPYALYLEHKQGKGRFVSCWLIAGLTALCTQLLMQGGNGYSSMIGSSGAAFGICAAAVGSFDGNKLYRNIGWAWIGVHLSNQIALGIISRQLMFSNIAFFAHAGGIIGGLCLAAIWRAQDKSKKSPDA